MARKKRRPEEEYTTLLLEIRRYHIDINGSVHHEVRSGSRVLSPSQHVYEFATSLRIDARCVYPPERENEEYCIEFYGSDRDDFEATLEAFFVRDERGAPKYMRRNGKDVPLYNAPRGLATIRRPRGVDAGHCWLWLPPSVVAQLLTVVPHVRPLYLDLQERKLDKQRWVTSFRVLSETTDYFEQ